MPEPVRYTSLREFYPVYLNEHKHPVCRRLHFIGSSISLLLLISAILTFDFSLLLLAVIQGYGLAWIGHYFFEHNRPATFEYPWLSFQGDWRMWWEMLTGKVPL